MFGEWYKKQSDIRKYIIYFVLFTVAFIVLFYCVNFNLFHAGKSLIINDDSIATYYEILMYRKSLLKEFWTNLIYNHRFEIPWINYNLTTDRNMGCVISHEIFDVFLWFVPGNCYEAAYCVVIAARIWLSGVTFSIYCFYMGYRKYSTMIAAFIYIFSGYGILVSFSQPVFTAMLYLTPLLLVGVEKIFQKKSGLFFSVMTAVSAFVNIVFLYYMTVGGVIYFLLRLLFCKDNWKIRLDYTLKVGMHYIIGIALAGVIFFPTVYSTLMSSRLGESTADNLLFYDISQYRWFFRFFFTGVSEGERYNYLGFSAMAFYPLAYVFFSKRHRFYKWWIGSIILLMNIPIFQMIAGMSAPSNRWTFCLGLSFAVIVARVLPELMDETMPVRLQRWVNIAALLYIILLVRLCRDTGAFITCGMFLASSILFNCIWKIQSICKGRFFLVFGMVAVTLTVNGFLTETEAYIGHFVDAGTANAELDSYPDILSCELEDETFWRADKEKFEGEVSCNLPYYYGYNGISSFYVLNPEVLSYLCASGNPGLIQSNKVSDLNGRVTDETLACVKYFFVRKGETGRIPYGFSFLKESVKNPEYDIYINGNTLPIGFTYGESISTSLFENMNIAEQQEVLLKKAVMEDGGTTPTALQSREIYNYGMLLSGIKQISGKYEVLEGGATIELTIPTEGSQEIYVTLADLQKYGSGGCQLKANYGDNEDIGYLRRDKTERANRINTFNFNVGTYDTEQEIKVTITFSDNEVNMGSIHVYGRNLESYLEDVSLLQEESLHNVKIEINGFEGDINTGDDKILCFSIPYTKGWTCYVDGQKTELLKANLMYSAIRLKKGNHHVVMKYVPPFLKLGVVTGVLGILLLFVMWIREDRMEGRRV